MFNFCPKCGDQLINKIPNGEDRNRLVCQECGFIFYQNPKPTATAIIEKNNQVLLIRRSKDPYKGDWDLVGGFVEVGETLEQAIEREVKEETGLTVTNNQYYFNWTDVYQNASDQHVSNNLGVHFLVQVKDEVPFPGDDASEVKWFDWNKLPLNIAGFHDVLKVIAKRKQDLGIK